MDIEDTLAALSTSTGPASLADLDTGVFARIDADHQNQRLARRGLAAAMCVATLAGVAGAAIPPDRHDAAPSFMMPNDLAPSSLLDNGQ